MEFKLPDIGEGLADAEIGRWLVQVGDNVKAEQPFVEIETEKVTVQIPAPQNARVTQLLANEGDIVPIGAAICVFEPLANGAVAEPVPKPTPAPTNGPTPSRPAVAAPAPSPGEVRALPAVRQLAKQLNVNLAQVAGTGPSGRITKEDVEKYAAGGSDVAPPDAVSLRHPFDSAQGKPVTADRQVGPSPSPPVPPSEERVPIRGIRRRIAQKMAHSLAATAQASYGEEIDVTELVRLRDEAKGMLQERGVHLTYMPYVIKAVVRSLKEYPHLNATVDDERHEIVVKRYYNIGIAIHTEGGLVVPVIAAADKKMLTQLATEVQEYAERARAGKLTLDEVRNSTFTLTNPGIIGGLFSTPILNYPEVGILAMHKIVKRPMVYEGQIAIRDIMNVALTFDHRIIDGVVAARFVQRVKKLLEAPGMLLIEGA